VIVHFRPVLLTSSAQLWFSGGFALFCAAFLTVRLWRRDWNAPQPFGDIRLDAMVGEDVLRGLRCALPCLTVFSWSMGVAAISLAVHSEASLLTAVAALGAVFSAALAFSVFLFNQPREVVPPALRSEPGYAQRHRRSSL